MLDKPVLTARHVFEYDCALGLHIKAGHTEGVLELPDKGGVLVGFCYAVMLGGVLLEAAEIDPTDKSAVSLKIQKKQQIRGPRRRKWESRQVREAIKRVPFVIGPRSRLVVELEQNPGDSHLAFYGKRFSTDGLAYLGYARVVQGMASFGASPFPG